MDAHVAVLHCVARAIVGDADGADTTLGAVQLRPHQVEAVRRLQASLERHGGALLADAPGLGKTYIALALARRAGGALVVAPAALREQWHRAAELADVRIQWCSVETLSRRPLTARAPMLIVDEAHHLRNPLTARYRHAATLATGKKVLLVTATPVHNRAADRDALLALFLGASASTLSSAALSQLVVRREADPELMPQRGIVRWRRVSSAASIGPALRALPPPLPAADGRAALALLRLTFAHAWSSSTAALDAALGRAIHHAAAIDDALAAGRWPTRQELRAWVTIPESSQLAFPELVAAPAGGDVDQARQALSLHLKRLVSLRRAITDTSHADATARAGVLQQVLQRHPRETVIAFARYACTVDALWRVLRFTEGVVALTARGVQSAGGGVRRRDVLAALASTDHRDARFPLRLVLSTELLGEGLDLRAASVVVHLDQPWTPARLEQREGRAMRLGAAHATATFYSFRPPRGAERLLALAARLHSKRAAMRSSVADGSARERLLQIVRPYLRSASGEAPPTRRVAALHASFDGWVAVVSGHRGQRRLLVCEGGAIAEDDVRLATVLNNLAEAKPAAVDPHRARAVRRSVRAWLDADASAVLAGAHSSSADVNRAIARRLDELLRAAPLTQRAQVQRRISLARRQMAAARGAGVERALAAAAALKSSTEMLDAIDRIEPSDNAAGPAARKPRLLALLLLVRKQ